MSFLAQQPYPPRAFEKAMVFIDGTNFLNRLRDGGLRCPSVRKLAEATVAGRQLARAYFYSTAEKVEKAEQVHGVDFLDECRIVLGDSVIDGSGKIREKGVDALLVADLIYHAAQKNCSYAVVISNDTDFVHALERVEDFGCNTAVIAIGVAPAERLQNACDDYVLLSFERLQKSNWAVPA